MKYKAVASIYMLSDILHTVAKLQGSLQSKELDLASMPTMASSTTKRLTELKEHPNTSTWFKDHSAVFTDPSQLGDKQVIVSEDKKAAFLQNIVHIYRVLSIISTVEWSLLICNVCL